MYLKNSRVFRMHVSWDDDGWMDRAQWKSENKPQEYLKNEIIEAMPKFKDDLNKCLNDGVEKVEVVATYEGSLFVFFKVVWDYAKIALDAYDICNMIRDISERFFHQKLNGKHGDSIRVDTHYYGKDDLYERRMLNRQIEYKGSEENIQISDCPAKVKQTKLDIRIGENGKICRIKIEGAVPTKDLLHLVKDIKTTFEN